MELLQFYTECFGTQHVFLSRCGSSFSMLRTKDIFCSGIQFNLLLSPYPCSISLLYLDLYVLGDDALTS